jgi:hypothetical protein
MLADICVFLLTSRGESIYECLYIYVIELQFHLSIIAFTKVTAGNMLVSAEEKLADVLFTPM